MRRATRCVPQHGDSCIGVGRLSVSDWRNVQAEVEEAAIAAAASLGSRTQGAEQLLLRSPQLVTEVAAKALGRAAAGSIRSVQTRSRSPRSKEACKINMTLIEVFVLSQPMQPCKDTARHVLKYII